MVQDEANWDFVKNELSHLPDFETDSGVIVSNRLLSHYLPVLQREFSVIQWLNTQYINKNLLKKI